MMLFVLLTTLLATLVSSQEDACYADQTDPYLLFATDTPYGVVNDMSARPVVIDQCEAQQFWIISRHGTRYADADEVDVLKDLYDLQAKVIKHHEQEGRGSLCAKDLENLKLWTLQVVSNLKSDLTPQGYSDLYNLAERFKIRFPSLFNQTVTKDSFKTRFTTKQRTAASAFAFVDGLFGTGMGLEFPEALDKDMLIKPYADCKKWDSDVDSNKDTKKEMKKFEEGSLMTVLLGTVSRRLGFEKTISIDDINLMYTACRYDKAWHLDKVSPWCAAFTEDDLSVLEFREDLLLYYNTGYGNDLNKRVGCPPVKDFLDRFSAIEAGTEQPAGVFYFTHHEMILLVLTSLDLAKDQQPLIHTNYDEMRNRQWRSSVISPFTANLAAVFFKCNTGETYRIQLYLNEHLLNIDGCNNGLCDWSYFKQKFGSISSSCNLDFC